MLWFGFPDLPVLQLKHLDTSLALEADTVSGTAHLFHHNHQTINGT
jgi:hypothetical protein